MELNRFTQKAQEAIQGSATIAARYHNQQIDCEHLFLALLEQSDGLASGLLQKMDVPPQTIIQQLEQHLEGLPQVSGPGSEQVYMTQKLNRVLDASGKSAGKMDDEYISVEHLLLGEKDSAANKFLKDAGVTKDNLMQAIQEIRGGQHITSENPEDTYQSLKKYGRDRAIRHTIEILSRRRKNNPVLMQNMV